MSKTKATNRKSGAAVRSSEIVGPDWRKVAHNRLEKLTMLERQCARLRDTLSVEMERELSIQLHAHCVPRSAYETKLKAIAEFVAERVRPKLYGR
jgi:hypothetical protein